MRLLYDKKGLRRLGTEVSRTKFSQNLLEISIITPVQLA